MAVVVVDPWKRGNLVLLKEPVSANLDMKETSVKNVVMASISLDRTCLKIALVRLPLLFSKCQKSML